MNDRFVPRITQPCSQDWNAMAGDEKRRFCEHCQLHVHNLSAMSDAEQQALLSQRGGRRCIGYVAPDHSIQVSTGTWLLLQRMFRPWRVGLALAALLVSFVLPSQATPTPPPKQPQPSPPPAAPTAKATPAPAPANAPVTMLGMVYTRPLWHRILFFWER